LLPNGSVLSFGQYIERYDPLRGEWHFLGKRIFSGNGTLLSDGRVLVIGEIECAIYDPVQQSWDTTAPMRQKRSGCTATLLKDGRVLVVGGAVWNGDDLSYLNTAEVFDPMYERWSVTGSLFFGREDHSVNPITRWQGASGRRGHC